MAKALVLGFGLSGRSAARFLEAKGHTVVGVDSSEEIIANESHFLVLHDSVPLDLSSFDFMVVSPGIDPRHPLYRKAQEGAVEVIGEAQLALQEVRQPCLAITGTNGKTTTTYLTEHILKTAGLKAKAVGNVGVSLTEYLLNPDPEEILIVELSSFQLETLQARVFDAAAILNISPNHLDRHLDMQEYAAAKCRLGTLLKEGKPLYVHPDVKKDFSHLLPEGKETVLPLCAIDNIPALMYRDWGAHDKENALAARMLASSFSVSDEQFGAALDTFCKPKHRLELVSVLNGVSYFDDSKGTNVAAVIQAVRAMKGKVVLIAGGRDKGSSYLPWKEHFRGKVKSILAIGEAAEKIEKELGDAFVVERAPCLLSATKRAAARAESGDSVLLSPGCSSYDMFRDYKERGELFAQTVKDLEEGRHQP